MSGPEIQVMTMKKSLGSGSSKIAFGLGVANSDKRYHFTIQNIEALRKFCVVKYSKIINWRTDFPEDFFVFKS